MEGNFIAKVFGLLRDLGLQISLHMLLNHFETET